MLAENDIPCEIWPINHVAVYLQFTFYTPFIFLFWGFSVRLWIQLSVKNSIVINLALMSLVIPGVEMNVKSTLDWTISSTRELNTSGHHVTKDVLNIYSTKSYNNHKIWSLTKTNGCGECNSVPSARITCLKWLSLQSDRFPIANNRHSRNNNVAHGNTWAPENPKSIDDTYNTVINRETCQYRHRYN